MKVGFAGSGNMAAALARGWAGVGPERGAPDSMLFTDAGSGRAAALAEEVGGEAVEGLRALADASDVVVLAFKPKALAVAAEEIDGWSGPAISLLGATSLAALHEALPSVAHLRTMPNVNVEVGRGVICHAPPADGPALAPALEMLGSVATLYELPEEQLDAATAVMGCSPAYFARAAGSVAEAGAAAGLDAELARELVARSVAGTGELLMRRYAAEIESAVASPGGSTEAGLEALAEHGGAEAFVAAVEASLARMAGTR